MTIWKNAFCLFKEKQQIRPNSLDLRSRSGNTGWSIVLSCMFPTRSNNAMVNVDTAEWEERVEAWMEARDLPRELPTTLLPG